MVRLFSLFAAFFSSRSIGKPLLALLVLLMLSGCTTKFAYNNAGWLVHWYVDDYIDLNQQQKKQFDQSFEKFITWHRNEELPKYLNWLRSIQYQLNDPSLTEQELLQQIQQANEQIFIFTRRLIDKAKPELLALAETLTAQQKKQLLTALNKKNNKTVTRFAGLKTLSSQKKKYRKNFQEALRERFGKLTSEQIGQLNQWQQKITPAYSQQLAARREWSRQLEEAFSHPESSLAPLFSPDRPWQSSAFKEIIIYNRILSEDFVAYMLVTRTPKQQKKLFKELNSLIRTIDSLQSK